MYCQSRLVHCARCYDMRSQKLTRSDTRASRVQHEHRHRAPSMPMFARPTKTPRFSRSYSCVIRQGTPTGMSRAERLAHRFFTRCLFLESVTPTSDMTHNARHGEEHPPFTSPAAKICLIMARSERHDLCVIR